MSPVSYSGDCGEYVFGGEYGSFVWESGELRSDGACFDGLSGLGLYASCDGSDKKRQVQSRIDRYIGCIRYTRKQGKKIRYKMAM